MCRNIQIEPNRYKRKERSFKMRFSFIPCKLLEEAIHLLHSLRGVSILFSEAEFGKTFFIVKELEQQV
ncbi:predicted protein [Chaetoceros tenuissimus]|uniref:Uncharacterized protein n=1 Tax=Chaetoceros tenuissimus TaxID=426638 RepID=A0AAD3CQ62_9STRA|nr:predicted protein [Chaetoceros tenuissimus]